MRADILKAPPLLLRIPPQHQLLPCKNLDSLSRSRRHGIFLMQIKNHMLSIPNSIIWCGLDGSRSISEAIGYHCVGQHAILSNLISLSQ